MINIDPAYYWHNMLKFTAGKDVMAGLIKSVFFAAFIALIACHKGFNADEGAEGVGRATTEAVVVSSLTILIANFFIAVIFNTVVPI
jgi:phospholipid/cholesterol/gamma-HCH transport system permease protein